MAKRVDGAGRETEHADGAALSRSLNKARQLCNAAAMGRTSIWMQGCISVVGGEQSAGGARGGALVRFPRGSPSAGADSDVCAKDSADHHAPWNVDFLWGGISRFAGGAEHTESIGDGRRSARDVGTADDTQKAGISTATKVAYLLLPGWRGGWPRGDSD